MRDGEVAAMSAARWTNSSDRTGGCDVAIYSWKRLVVRTVAVTVKANRYGLSGRSGYGAKGVRPGSESLHCLTRGLPVT